MIRRPKFATVEFQRCEEANVEFLAKVESGHITKIHTERVDFGEALADAVEYDSASVVQFIRELQTAIDETKP